MLDSKNASVLIVMTGALITKGMSGLIPSSARFFFPQNSWFDETYSDAIQELDIAYWGWKNSCSPITLISLSTGALHGYFSKDKWTFIKRECENFFGFPTNKNFWNLVKIASNNFYKSAFLNLTRSDGSVVISPSEKANFFGLLFSTNSILGDYGIHPPTPFSLRWPMCLLMITDDQVHKILKSMNIRKASASDDILLSMVCVIALWTPFFWIYSFPLHSLFKLFIWSLHITTC